MFFGPKGPIEKVLGVNIIVFKVPLIKVMIQGRLLKEDLRYLVI